MSHNRRMRRLNALLGAAAAMLGAGEVRAGDMPLYQSAPAWVVAPPPLDPATFAKGASVLLLDQQERLEHGTVWSYTDTAIRADTPEALTQLGTLSGVWSPTKGDFIVHRAVILRGKQEIDLLAGAGKFTVLQRERGLERRVLDGALTATLPVTGLQVGDVLRFAYTVSRSDTVLGGHAQDMRALPVAPAPFQYSRLRVSWPTNEAVRWQIGPKVAIPAGAVQQVKGDTVLTLPLPLPKRDPLPEDAPMRFRVAPTFQIGDFATWADVSRAMAPLFATQGTIAEGSPVAREVDAIMAATNDPRARAARALELVQSRISYLLLGMNNGNYEPQSPAETWEKRYGDCKAKTLLLLAMLHRMGITAEPVLARIKAGDAVPTFLPMVAAFDHVLVHATIDGRDLWLDGTGASSRLADLDDVPAFENVLPLRPEGADILPLAWRNPQRPNSRLTIAIDETAGLDMPALVDVTLELKGAAGATLGLAAAQATPEKRDDLARKAIKALFSEINLVESTITPDAAAGTTAVRVKGIVGSRWRLERAGALHTLHFGPPLITFRPDRARPAWRDLPVVIGGPASTEVTVLVKLPEGGRGYRIEGDPSFSGMLAGYRIDRQVALADGTVQVRLRHDAPGGAEVAPADVAAEKAKVSAFNARAPQVRAPVDAKRFWQVRTPGRARFAALDKAYAAIIAAHPDDGDGFAARARFRRIASDRAGAYADFAKALSLEPTIALYADRATMFEEDGRFDAALADMIAAQDIDPANHAIAATRAHLLVKLGRKDEALALRLDELDRAGNDRAAVVARFADAQSDAGQTEAALADLAQAAIEKPGSPDILNEMCWIKGTRQVALDTALKDCTRAIELADNPAGSLDSRAMIYFRMGRFEEALDDLGAALDASPGLAGSLFMRAVIRARQGQIDAARDDLAGARALSPAIDRQYADYGITARF